MSFTKQFSIFPHGVHKSGSGEILAVFKMMVTLGRSESSNISDLESEWDQLKTEINDLKWSYEFVNTTLTIKSDDAAHHDPHPLQNELRLIHRSGIADEINSHSFKFGEGYRGSSVSIQYFDAFKPLFEKVSFQWTQPPVVPFPHQRLRQMGIETDPSNSEEFGGKDPYGFILGEVNKYSKLVGDKNPQNQFYNEDLDFVTIDKENIQYLRGNATKNPDLMPTYASILEEPDPAEIRFGVIREFRIPINDLLHGEEKRTYNLAVLNPGEQDETIRCRVQKSDQKYFHGLEKIIFDRKFFSSINIEYTDPYNKFLNKTDKKSDPHPDGMYLVVEYPDTFDEKNDPFNIDSVKGFNVVTNQNLQSENNYYSLSYHKKSFEFLKKEGFEYSICTSGVLSPQGEILTKSSRYRANVLFAWRGDNLLVNRTRVESSNENGQFDQMETISEHETEGFMVSKELFTVKDELVCGTQIQLYDRGYNYDFHLRTVTPTGYYAPLQKEIDLIDSTNSKDHLLSFDELIKIENLTPFKSSEFNVRELVQVPIKTLTFLGSKSYSNMAGSEDVDGHQHLVLREELKKLKEETSSKIQSSIKETSRFIYPPKIKFEDFRFHGWLSSMYLGTISEQDEFVRICLEYERKSRIEIPQTANSGVIESIQYMSDIRGKLVSIVPGDLFTLNYLLKRQGKIGPPHSVTRALFDYNHEHPYYDGTSSNELRFTKEANGLNTISIHRNGVDTKIHESLLDGIFIFRSYCTDDNFNYYDDFLNIPHSFVQLKASSVAKPPKPEITLELDLETNKEIIKFPATRTPIFKWQNSWFHIFKLNFDIKDPENGSHLWNSIKFQETTSSLKLTEDKQKLQELVQENPPKQAMIAHEYPYEIFLAEEPDHQLKTSITPFEVNIVIQFESKALRNLIETDVSSIRVFKLMFNDSDVLEIHYNGRLYIPLNNNRDETVKVKTDVKNELRLVYSQLHRYYELFYENPDKPVMTLTKLLDPSISINACEVYPDLMDHLILRPDNNKVSLDRTNKFIFINDEGHPYYRKKLVTLFGSSIFQAYYPSVQDELSIGSFGTTFELEIPNNIKPKTPLLESDILLIQEYSNTTNVKTYKVGNVARILLEKDFMREGENKLGIILKKISSNSDSEESYTSQIGEDITKLTTVDWSKDNLLDAIDFDTKTLELQKYCSQTDISYYRVGDVTFEVLECTPYYNTQLQNWQVLLPLLLKETETLFVKFSAIKIAPGHSVDCEDTVNSAKNPYKDPTLTNWSEISEATHVPVYNSKSYQLVSESSTNDELRLFIDSASIYKKKTYCILAKTNNNAVANIFKNSPSNKEQLKDFIPFTFKRAQADVYTKEQGKVLITSNLNKALHLRIDSQNTKSIFILEFENNDNASIVGKERPEFIKYNPLFDSKGLRLINMAEFKL
jgi:hypothetical protein